MARRPRSFQARLARAIRAGGVRGAVGDGVDGGLDVRRVDSGTAAAGDVTTGATVVSGHRRGDRRKSQQLVGSQCLSHDSSLGEQGAQTSTRSST